MNRENPGVGSPCSVCGEPYTPLRGGMCRKHYRRVQRNGHPEMTTSLGMSGEDRLAFHGFSILDSGCWEWGGAISRDGYGKLKQGNRTVRAHRFAYETWVGPIPKDLLIRHKCDNRLCINPEHIETGTPKDNTADMLSRGRGRWQKEVK